MADTACAGDDAFVLLTRDSKTSCKVHLFGITLYDYLTALLLVLVLVIVDDGLLKLKL